MGSLYAGHTHHISPKVSLPDIRCLEEIKKISNKFLNHYHHIRKDAWKP